MEVPTSEPEIISFFAFALNSGHVFRYFTENYSNFTVLLCFYLTRVPLLVRLVFDARSGRPNCDLCRSTVLLKDFSGKVFIILLYLPGSFFDPSPSLTSTCALSV